MEPHNYESGAAGSPPSAPASPSNGYPTGGDPQTATPATKPGAFWFYKVGESLRKIITDAGLTPDDSDLTQLKTAMVSPQSDVDAGTDDNRFVTPKKLQGKINNNVLGGGDQAWQDKTASRVDGVTYTNTTGRAIQISASSRENSGNQDGTISIIVDGIIVARSFSRGAGTIFEACASAIVPNNSTYRVEVGNMESIGYWAELRT